MLKDYTGADGSALMLNSLVGETVTGVYRAGGNTTIVFESGAAIRFGSSSSFWDATAQWRDEHAALEHAAAVQLRELVHANTFLKSVIDLNGLGGAKR